MAPGDNTRDLLEEIERLKSELERRPGPEEVGYSVFQRSSFIPLNVYQVAPLQKRLEEETRRNQELVRPSSVSPLFDFEQILGTTGAFARCQPERIRVGETCRNCGKRSVRRGLSPVRWVTTFSQAVG